MKLPQYHIDVLTGISFSISFVEITLELVLPTSTTYHRKTLLQNEVLGLNNCLDDRQEHPLPPQREAPSMIEQETISHPRIRKFLLDIQSNTLYLPHSLKC